NTGSIQTFDNSGTIKNTNNNKYNFYIKSTIENFKNSGLIESKGYAVTFQEGSTINNFNNTGTIITKENNGRDAVWINKTTIQTFSNTGTIKGEGNNSVGVNIFSGSSISSFENKGLIEGNAVDNATSSTSGFSAVSIGSTIDNFINSGTIISNKSHGVAVNGSGAIKTFKNTNTGTIQAKGDAIMLRIGRNVGTLINEGKLKGTAGIHIWGSTIENLTNKGTIESTGTNTNNKQEVWNGGINVTTYGNNRSKIGTFTNEGTIDSKTNGVFFEAGTNIETIVNKGSIKAEQYGIYVTNNWNRTLGGKIGKIVLEKGSVVESKQDAININNPKMDNITSIDGIDLQEGATLKSINGAAIKIAPNNHITGDINIAGKIEAKTGISNQGNISGNISASGNTPLVIENKGNGNIGGSINTSDNVALSLTNSGNGNISGSITSTSNAPVVLKNEDNANITGGVSASGKGKVTIENKGSAKIGGDIKNEGGGNLSITNSNDGNIAGHIINSGSGNLNLKNEGNAKIEKDITNSGSGDLKLSNEGNAQLGANIKNEGSGNLSISNTGKVSDTTKIESNGSGKVEVEQWLVSTNSAGEVKPLEITGKNLSAVSVSNVTFDVANISNLSILAKDPEKIINIDTSKDTNIKNAEEINAKVFAKAEFKTNDPSVNVNVDSLTKTLSFSIDGAKTSAAALGQTLISNTQARATFVSSVMGNAMNAVHLIHNQGSANVYSNFNKPYEEGETYYANFDNLSSDALIRTSMQENNRNHLAFMLPYISKSDTSLAGGLTAKGQTKG
ncbi:beta strand repeat-containing protein, partial [Helicobacter mesocricetorum]|uniref:beta strand repeat-containing protein n=1 Tax=Helicobacter mesocricetorum TaxID=87012 RepID=UPI00389911F2